MFNLQSENFVHIGCITCIGQSDGRLFIGVGGRAEWVGSALEMNFLWLRPPLLPGHLRDGRLPLEAGQLLVLQAPQCLVQGEVSVRDDTSIARVVCSSAHGIFAGLAPSGLNAQGFAAIAVEMRVARQQLR
jgi:hypothetical protein